MPANKCLLGNYDAANQFLGERDSRHYPSIKYTIVYRTTGGNFRGYGYKCEYRANAELVIAVRYHNTDVVLYYPDGRVELNSGGYMTNTTKHRLNDFGRTSWQNVRYVVYQKNYDWYVSTSKGTYDFKDHMVILPDGTVQNQMSREFAPIVSNIGAFFVALAEYASAQAK